MCSCATTKPALSPMQKRQISTRIVESNYENAYRASLTILQDQGYVIKNTDMASGLIVASIDREASKSTQAWESFWIGVYANKGTFIEVTVIVNKINEKSQELRMNIQETMYNQLGAKTNIRQIEDAKVYETLFNQIEVETKRREAAGR